MLIDKPLAAVEIESENFFGQSIEIITIPESAGAHIKSCYFSGFGDRPAITISHKGSYCGRVLFSYPPETSIQNCYFDGSINF